MMLFERMLLKRDEDLSTYFHYEISPYPMSQFTNCGMKKKIKFAMYDEFESVPDSVLDVIIVIDRGLKYFHQLRLVQTWLGNALNPEQWGWSRQHGEFMPIKTTLKPAHQVILKMILCSCKGSCSSPQCTCVKSGVTCESLCKNCEGVSCANCEKELPTPLLDDELDGYDDLTIDEEQNEHDFLEFLIFLDYIHVMLDQQLLTAEYGGELLVALQGAELQYNIQNQSVPLTVTWTREVRQHHMDENMKCRMEPLTGGVNRASCERSNLDYPGSTIRVLCRLSPNTAWPNILSQLTPYCLLAPYCQNFLATHCLDPHRAIIIKRGKNRKGRLARYLIIRKR
uniref:Tesmin/TSO1-like CXC domain-containing protein n=1 Tax=Timema tahoe TaxID=61484 RepID=A0A7R9IQH0_9NEOP|nr:unnamed protein product [Timema tahoe]